MTDKTVNMYLENCIQEIYDKKNIKTSEVIVITKVRMINLKTNINSKKTNQKNTYYQRM